MLSGTPESKFSLLSGCTSNIWRLLLILLTFRNWIPIRPSMIFNKDIKTEDIKIRDNRSDEHCGKQSKGTAAAHSHPHVAIWELITTNQRTGLLKIKFSHFKTGINWPVYSEITFHPPKHIITSKTCNKLTLEYHLYHKAICHSMLRR